MSIATILRHPRRTLAESGGPDLANLALSPLEPAPRMTDIANTPPPARLLAPANPDYARIPLREVLLVFGGLFVAFLLIVATSLFVLHAKVIDPHTYAFPFTIRKQGDRHQIRGGISGAMVARIREMAEAGDLKEVEFVTEGGWLESGIDIGQILRDHDVTIVQSAAGRCYSACIKIIGASDMRRTRIHDRAIFMFHAGRYTWDPLAYYIFEYPFRQLAYRFMLDTENADMSRYQYDKLQPGLFEFLKSCTVSPLLQVDPIFLSWAEIKQIGQKTFPRTCDQIMARPEPY